MKKEITREFELPHKGAKAQAQNAAPKKTAQKRKTAAGVVAEILHMPTSKTDPTGAYTGRPAGEETKPVQDADDL